MLQIDTPAVGNFWLRRWCDDEDDSVPLSTPLVCDDDDVDSVVELICAQRNRVAMSKLPRLIWRKTSQTMMELAKIFREKKLRHVKIAFDN